MGQHVFEHEVHSPLAAVVGHGVQRFCGMAHAVDEFCFGWPTCLFRSRVQDESFNPEGGGRVAAHEIMIGTPAIRNLIREDKVAQMYSAIQTGGSLGMQTLDSCLKGLVAKGIVSREAAREKSKTPENF